LVRTVATDMRYYVHQADVVLVQANPISGTQYVVLPETTFVSLYQMTVAVTWTVQPAPLELHLDIDGNDIPADSGAPVSGTQYFYRLLRFGAGAALEVLDTGMQNTDIKGKVAAVTAETTGGTVQNLEARIKYARYI